MKFYLCALVAVAAPACDDDHDDHDHDAHAEDGPAADACEHMKDGPAQAVTAGGSEADAASVTFAHTRVDIALGDLDGMKGGYVKYEADEATDFTFFLDADVPIEWVGGAFESTESVDECAEVTTGYTAELDVGPAVLKIGPTDRETVRLVTVEAGPEHVHE